MSHCHTSFFKFFKKLLFYATFKFIFSFDFRKIYVDKTDSIFWNNKNTLKLSNILDNRDLQIRPRTKEQIENVLVQCFSQQCQHNLQCLVLGIRLKFGHPLIRICLNYFKHISISINGVPNYFLI